MDLKIKGNLTPYQKKILDYISRFYIQYGYSPSYKEIAKEFDFKSDGSVTQYLDALENKGFISRGRASRQIYLNQPEESQEIFMLGIIAAGNPIEPLENPESIKVPKSMISSHAMCYALKISGDSMIDDGIADGDIILVQHQKTANNGDIVVAITENGATLKRFYNEKGQIRLEPRNQRLSIIYPQEIEIRGKFLGLIRHNE